MNLREIITDVSQHFILREDFEFQPLVWPLNIYDAIVIRNHNSYRERNFRIPKITHSLTEQIKFINQINVEKSVIYADDISFIPQCPTLQYLKIIPMVADDKIFDFSPLYELPEIKFLDCVTDFGNATLKSSPIDYRKINGLQFLTIRGQGHFNYNHIGTLKSLLISGYRHENLLQMFSSTILDTLSVGQSKISSLDGIDTSAKMQCLSLYYNRSLKDISRLAYVKNTLKSLRIGNCPKIEDFSVLGELENLELLELTGSNEVPDFGFLRTMKNLKTLIVNINVKDGNLAPCLDLSYVHVKNRKHYNFKDKNLPKGRYVRGNETIEEWRRLE